VRACAGSSSYWRLRGKLPLDHHLWTATVQSASGYGSRRRVCIAFGARICSATRTDLHGILHVGLLVTRMHVSRLRSAPGPPRLSIDTVTSVDITMAPYRQSGIATSFHTYAPAPLLPGRCGQIRGRCGPMRQLAIRYILRIFVDSLFLRKIPANIRGTRELLKNSFDVKEIRSTCTPVSDTMRYYIQEFNVD